MKITVAQIKSSPGHFGCMDKDSNRIKINRVLERALGDGSDLIVFPEGMVHGYMSMDLILNSAFIEEGENDVRSIVQASKNYKGLTIVLGSFRYIGDSLYNVALVIKEGNCHTVAKTLLPEYDIFFENRYFESAYDEGNNPELHSGVFEIAGNKVGICICEDMWDKDYHFSPVSKLVEQGAHDLIINISCSPYHIGKDKERNEIIRGHAMQHDVDFLYVNAVGTHDGYDGEILFEGRSRYYGYDGTLKWMAPAFEECIETINTESFPFVDPHQKILSESNEIATLRKALVSGVRDYCDRFGFEKVVLGMSGGIDSALAAAICVDALGAENVTGITMPSKYSSEGSVSDSEMMAKLMGFGLVEIPIREAHDVALTCYKDYMPLNGKGMSLGIKPLTDENIQPRLRMLYLMMFSNNEGALLITTGNKTELALGYCTLYGDMAGGLAILADIDKLIVRQLFAHYIQNISFSMYLGNGVNDVGVKAMKRILEKAPSAELAPDQTDEASFGLNFEQLVPLVNQIVDGNDSLAIVGEQHPNIPFNKVNEIWNRIKSQEFKRRQVSPGIRVTPKAFGIGRRIPMKHGW